MVNSFLVLLPKLILALWPIWTVCLFLLVFKLYQFYRFNKAGMGDIDKMNGNEFESFLGLIFKRNGYQVKQTGSPSGDYGADLIITKDGISVAVQAKRHNSVIGVDAVREVLGSIKMYNCSTGIVVTNNYFTSQSKILAKINNIELWDRKVLTQMILEPVKK